MIGINFVIKIKSNKQMGNKGSLPEGEMIDNEMIELSKIVGSESFK